MDGDLSDEGILTYSLTQTSPAASQPSFVIHPLTADLAISGTIDEDTDYQLTVVATVILHAYSRLPLIQESVLMATIQGWPFFIGLMGSTIVQYSSILVL